MERSLRVAGERSGSESRRFQDAWEKGGGVVVESSWFGCQDGGGEKGLVATVGVGGRHLGKRISRHWRTRIRFVKD